MKKLTLIIISYNSSRVITQCLSELLLSNSFDVIIVDNASTDHSADTLKSRFPDCQVISLKTNIGYGRATNLALKALNTPYALLLNPDIYATVQSVTALLEQAKVHSGAAIYAPATKSSELTHQGPIKKSWVLGAAMLFDMSKLKRIGFFDENIFLFYEEKDLCKRARAMHEDIILFSDIMFEHDKGTASGSSKAVTNFKDWHVGWSSLYYLKKHQLDKGKHSTARLLMRYRMKAIFSLNQRKREKFQYRLQGMFSFLKQTPAFDENGNPQALDILRRKSET